MPVKTHCPNPGCDASISIDPAHLARLDRCAACGTRFDVGEAAPVDGPGRSVPDLETRPDPEPSPAALPAGALRSPFGRYQVVQKLGQGGMGAVYLAQDTELDRPVALKVPNPELDADPEAMARFRREARAAASFHYPNFCPIYDVGQIDGTSYLAMAYLEGRPLKDHIARDRPMRPRTAARIVRRLALALALAHRRGIVHRDLKPANIMVDPRGTLIIMDFGLARRSGADDAELTRTGAVMGTPAYMSPEQARGDRREIGPATDIYALGVILYELLTGRRPFEGSALMIISQVVFQEPPPPSEHRPGLDPALEANCLKAMAKAIPDRHASMTELADALGTILDRPEPARPQPRPSPIPPVREERGAPPPPRRPRVGRLAVGAALLAALGVIIYVATDRGTLKIEGLDPKMVVRVDGDEVRVEKVGEPIVVRSGAHGLQVSRGDMLVNAPRSFTIRRGQETVVSAELLDLKPPTKIAADAKPAAVVPPSKPNEDGSPKPPARLTISIGMELALISAGKFVMGSPDGEDGRHDDEPAHPATISRPFSLGVHEVTQAEYRQVMDENPSDFSAEGQGKGRVAGQDTARFPVENVSWFDAINFCNRLSSSAKEQLAPYYEVRGQEVTIPKLDGDGYRLPTEAEWEYACRAGTATR